MVSQSVRDQKLDYINSNVYLFDEGQLICKFNINSIEYINKEKLDKIKQIMLDSQMSSYNNLFKEYFPYDFKISNGYVKTSLSVDMPEIKFPLGGNLREKLFGDVKDLSPEQMSQYNKYAGAVKRGKMPKIITLSQELFDKKVVNLSLEEKAIYNRERLRRLETLKKR